jgi:multiple sugar transport system substrate-binding protein
LPLDEWQTPVSLAFQRGARLLRGDDEWGDFRSDAFRSAFMFYLSFFQRRLAPAGEGQIANIYQDFAGGFFSVFITGPWNLGELAARMPAELKESWATAPMPGDGSEAPGVSIAGGASLAIAADTPHADAARDLVAFSPPPSSTAFYRLSGDLPARPSAWTADVRPRSRVAAFWRQLQPRATARIGWGASPPHRPRRRGGGARRSHHRRRAGAARSRSGRHPREAAVDVGTEGQTTDYTDGIAHP